MPTWSRGTSESESTYVKEWKTKEKGRVLCVSSSETRYIQARDVRHAIYQMTPITVPQFLRTSQVVGRDGELSRITVICSGEVARSTDTQSAGRMPSLLSIKGVIRGILFAKRMEFRRFGGQALCVDELTLSLQHQVSHETIGKVVQHLEDTGWCDGSAPTYRNPFRPTVYFSYSLNEKAKGSPREWLLTYLIEQRQVGPTPYLNTLAAAESCGVESRHVYAALLGLSERGLLNFEPAGTARMVPLPKYDPTDQAIDSLARAFYRHITDAAEKRVSDAKLVRHVFGTAPCINAALAEAVGTQLPRGRRKCGRCSAVSSSTLCCAVVSCCREAWIKQSLVPSRTDADTSD